MSSNGDSIPKTQLECVRCQQRWSVPFPKMEIHNTLRCSVITATHDKLTYCPNNKCRQPYILQIVAAQQVIFQATPANDNAIAEIEGSRIISPVLNLVQ